MKENKRIIGLNYENKAIQYLEQFGYELIERNVFTPYGEIDLIMCKGCIFYFVEVKFRSSNAYGSPRDAIHTKKIKHMKQSAGFYVSNTLNKKYPYSVKFKISYIGIVKEMNQEIYDFIEDIFE